jgi:hypothetical protein
LGVVGDTPHSVESWGISVPLGTIQYGQTKDTVVLLDGATGAGPYISATLRCDSSLIQEKIEITLDGPSLEAPTFSNHFIELQQLRQRACGALSRLIELMIQNQASEALSTLSEIAGKLKVFTCFFPPYFSFHFLYFSYHDFTFFLKASLQSLGRLPRGSRTSLDQSMDIRERIQGLLQDFEGQISLVRFSYHIKIFLKSQ